MSNSNKRPSNANDWLDLDEHFTKLPNSVVRSFELDAVQKAIIAAIASSEDAFPSLVLLSKYCGVGKTRIQTAIKDLKTRDVISSKSKSGESCHYRIQPEFMWKPKGNRGANDYGTVVPGTIHRGANHHLRRKNTKKDKEEIDNVSSLEPESSDPSVIQTAPSGPYINIMDLHSYEKRRAIFESRLLTEDSSQLDDLLESHNFKTVKTRDDFRIINPVNRKILTGIMLAKDKNCFPEGFTIPKDLTNQNLGNSLKAFFFPEPVEPSPMVTEVSSAQEPKDENPVGVRVEVG